MAKKKTASTSRGKKAQVAKPARPPNLFEEMDRWFEEEFPNRWMQRFRMNLPFSDEIDELLQRRLPKVDVIDHKRKVVVRAELPGVNKDDLDVTLSDDAITIKGETRHEKTEDKKGDYYQNEISQANFMRRVSLPDKIDVGSAKAKFKNGILEIALKKAKKSKRQNIKVE